MLLDRHRMNELVASAIPGARLLRDAKPLAGGLEGAVAKLTLGYTKPCGGQSQRRIVVKQLHGPARREASRYQLLEPSGITPKLLATAEHDDHTYLFMEALRPADAWPWRDSRNTRAVLEHLARVHRVDATFNDWDYETELASSAQLTLDAARVAGVEIRPLTRVVENLSELRARLFAALGTTLIHGDVHSGNVILRRSGKVVLLDWGRSRAGSPLEDVASWLLSLRHWEPAAARDHDTLFRNYLEAASLPSELTREVREAYWFAAASNVLAGALRYHLHVGSGASVAQAADALRVIRRADARLRARRSPARAFAER